jgi:hypothetical protein
MTVSAGDGVPVLGIDFSAAADAGRATWIARGVSWPNGLEVHEVTPAAELPGGGRGREASLRALRQLIADSDAVCGLDFPFAVARTLMGGDDWASFVGGFGERYRGAEAFREACRKGGAGRELRRRTDREARTPFAPANLRMFKQTYHGIRDLLAPLVRERRACVLPLQGPDARLPLVLEVCPASTLKSMRLYRPYKGRAPAAARAALVDALVSSGTLLPCPSAVRERIEPDGRGDAIDAVLAAVACARAIDRASYAFARDHLIEGYVFF